MSSRGIVEIDGSMLEGGGQIVRSSIALSALVLRPVRIFNIRAKRPNPGLQAQHLTGVKAVAALCSAKLEGAYKGSRELTFIPQRRVAGRFRFDVGTAGSISLVLQALLPAAAFAPGECEFEITGGTDVAWSPPIDYVRYVLVPVLAKMGYRVEVGVLRRGHYPRGGGHVIAKTYPVPFLKPLQELEFGKLVEIRGISHCVKLPKHVAERQAKAAEKCLRDHGIDVPIKIGLEYYEPNRDPHLGPGSGIVLWAISDRGLILGADALGERGKRAEVVGEEAAKKLIQEIERGMAFDKHMGDMLIPYIAIASGTSEIGVSELTLHTKTNIVVTEMILGVKFEVKGDLGERAVIKVKGLGLRNEYFS